MSAPQRVNSNESLNLLDIASPKDLAHSGCVVEYTTSKSSAAYS